MKKKIKVKTKEMVLLEKIAKDVSEIKKVIWQEEEEEIKKSFLKTCTRNFNLYD